LSIWYKRLSQGFAHTLHRRILNSANLVQKVGVFTGAAKYSNFGTEKGNGAPFFRSPFRSFAFFCSFAFFLSFVSFFVLSGL
jgi:hypothetical protein